MITTYIYTSCPSCSTAYKIEASLVPPSGAKAKCKVCNGVVIVRPRRRPTVWVFTDDPATQRVDTQAAIGDVSGFEMLLLDTFERQALADLPVFPTPDVVVFGEMHALLEDPVLARVVQEGAARILLHTHQNDDLEQAVLDFCGFDHRLLLPLDTALFEAVLQDVIQTREDRHER